MIAAALFAAVVAGMLWMELRRSDGGKGLTLEDRPPAAPEAPAADQQPEDGPPQAAPPEAEPPETEPHEVDAASPGPQLMPAQELAGSERVATNRRVGRTRALVSVVDRDELLSILTELKDIPQQNLLARADRTVEYDDFADPASRRELVGRLCLFRGTLRRFVTRRDVDLRPVGVESLYEGQIQDADGRWYSFYCFEPPRPAIQREDIAVLAGMYYRLIKYPTRGGEEMVTPLLVGRTLGRRPGAAMPRSVVSRILQDVPDWAIWTVLGGLFLVAGAVALLKAGSRKSSPIPSEKKFRGISLHIGDSGPEQESNDPDAG